MCWMGVKPASMVFFPQDEILKSSSEWQCGGSSEWQTSYCLPELDSGSHLTSSLIFTRWDSESSSEWQCGGSQNDSLGAVQNYSNGKLYDLGNKSNAVERKKK